MAFWLSEGAWDGSGGKRVEGVLASSAGGRGRVKQVWGRSDLFRSLGLTRGIGDEEDEEVCAAAKLRGELWGVCAPLSWATLPAGRRHRNCLISAPLFNFISVYLNGANTRM